MFRTCVNYIKIITICIVDYSKHKMYETMPFPGESMFLVIFANNNNRKYENLYDNRIDRTLVAAARKYLRNYHLRNY
jgi:hypothetical protein